MNDKTQSYDPNQVNPGEEVTMTQKALDHIRHEISKQGHGIGIRLGTKKSGCNGYAYVIDIIDEIKTNEFQFVIANDMTLVVDKKDWSLVKGTQLDYVREGINHKLMYRNPNETGSCGCGESFSVKTDE